MSIVKIAMIGIGGAILALIVKQFQKEYSIFVLLGVCLLLLSFLTSNVTVVIEFMENMGEKIEISSVYLKLLIKLMAIAYISQTASGICSDLGYQSIAFQVETIGKISILILSLPIISSLLETIEQIITAGN